MKRVLVTGASGFIGRHCLGPLRERGYEVHAVSANRASMPAADAHCWHRVDLLEPGAAERLVRDVAPTHLLHLAWYVVPGQLISSPANYAWVKASIDLVEAFAAAGGARMSVCGSGYEYDWRYGYCSEQLTPSTPDTVYGACKQALHLMTETLAVQRRVSMAWPRVFFLYGPHEHPQRLVSSVAISLLRDQPAKASHGLQIRDYLHVQDVADGLVAVLDSRLEGTVNVSSGRATQIREIVTMMGRLAGRPDLVQLGALPARANDAPLVVGSCERITAEAGWRPRYDLEQGLRQTLDWWRTQEQAAS